MKQNGEIKHYLYHLQQFGYHRSKVKYKVTSICIRPLLSSAQIHKEHSNSKSPNVWPGEGCAKRGTWYPGPYCPKLNLVQHSPWGLAAYLPQYPAWNKKSAWEGPICPEPGWLSFLRQLTYLRGLVSEVFLELKRERTDLEGYMLMKYWQYTLSVTKCLKRLDSHHQSNKEWKEVFISKSLREEFKDESPNTMWEYKWFYDLQIHHWCFQWKILLSHY